MLIALLITSRKSEETHAELDRIQDVFEDDAGRRIVIHTERPLHPASQRLMDTLGVQVVVVSSSVETPVKSTCNVPNCGWWVEGPADYVRDRAREHREERHPEIARFERRQMAAARASQEALRAGRASEPVIEPETPVVEPATPAADPPAVPEADPPDPPVIDPATGRHASFTQSPASCRAAVEAYVRETGRVPSATVWRRERRSPSHVTMAKHLGGWTAIGLLAREILDGGGSDSAASSEVEKKEVVAQSTDLDLIRRLDADELIVVGSVLQAVGRVRALTSKDRALPLIQRLVDDLRTELRTIHEVPRA